MIEVPFVYNLMVFIASAAVIGMAALEIAAKQPIVKAKVKASLP